MRTRNFIILTTILFVLPFTACAQKKQGGKTTVAAKKDTLTILTEKAEAGDAAAQNTLGTWYYQGKNVDKNYETAFAWWKKSADQGNAYAIGNLAMCYQLGNGTKKDSVMAVGLYKSAIKKGNTELIKQHEKLAEKRENTFSNMLMYDLYNTGTGVKHDAAKVAFYLEHTAEMGNTEQQYRLALHYLNSNQADKAAEWFNVAAQNGSVGATYYSGYLLHQGMGVAQDKEKGIALMKKADESGFIAATSQLGIMFYEGDGVDVDYTQAVKYLKKSAAQNGNSQWLLGLCYLRGNGVAQDYYKAAQWLAESALSHEKEFNELLKEDNEGAFSQYLMGLKHYYVNKDYDAAIECFKKVEKAKVAEGKTMQAICLANDNYTKNNAKKAAKLLEKASAESAVANYYLSTLYENGKGVKKDEAKALELLQKAAEDDIAYAQCKLGDMYMMGRGVPKDLVKAATLYLQAESLRHLTPESAKNLAQCYTKKISSIPDVDQAEKRIKQLQGIKDNDRLLTLLNKLSK